MKSLYLDDERNPTTNRDWAIVRTYDDAINYIKENGVPSYCSFDHDIGSGKTGYDFVKWLVEQDLNGIYTIPNDFDYNVHSANVVGARNIEEYLNAYFTYKRNNLW